VVAHRRVSSVGANHQVEFHLDLPCPGSGRMPFIGFSYFEPRLAATVICTCQLVVEE
jgi:hypothetical protein